MSDVFEELKRYYKPIPVKYVNLKNSPLLGLINAWDDASFWENLKAPSEIPNEPECPLCKRKAAPEHVVRDVARGKYTAKCWWCENRWQG